VKDAIAEAKRTIDETNLDLVAMNSRLKQEFNKIRTSVKELEEKRKSLDEEIAKIKDKIPGEPKELKEPQYHNLEVVR
jgi:predicted  nucleic acid-binding Zn-ribbon protein